MNASFLDTAVKLAGLGAAGVCVFGLLCCLWLLTHPDKTGGPQAVTQQPTTLIKWFMGLCLLMAIVTALSAFFGTRVDRARLKTLEAESTRLEAENKDLTAKVQKQEYCLGKYRQRQREYATNYKDSVGAVRAACQLLPAKLSDPILNFLDTMKPRPVDECE